ncbi:MAG TPA: glutathione S-transferase family protein [Woeseiaceae bacterium]|nr:glutathione S-transferase family protein [Woeseiaceae bacterium]
MKFYDCQSAPSPRRVRIFLAEKGVELASVQVDLGAGEHLGETFRSLNPDCTVPVLELDDGTALTESFAICQYLESVYPDPPLMGRDDRERALVTQWNAKVESQGLAAVAEAFRNRSRGFTGRALTGPEGFGQIPELVERGRRRAELFLARLDAELAEREFVAGDVFTVADITALVTVDFAGRIKLPLPEGADNLRRWHEVVSARPGAKV